MAALRSLRAVNCAQLTAPARQATRAYSGKPADANPKKSNFPFVLAGIFAAGIGGYAVFTKGAASKAASDVAAASPAAAAPTPVGQALDKDNFIPITLKSIEPYNHNSQVYHFAFPEEHKDKPSGIHTAGLLVVKTPDGEKAVKDDKGKPIIRPYTPISPETQLGEISLLIKEYKGGKLTPYIASLKPGEQLLAKGPIQKFKYEPNSYDRGLLIAGGSGITPMYQVISHALEKPEDKTKFTLIYSNVTEADILLRKQLDELAKQHPDRLQVQYVLDKAPWGWKGETGFVDSKLINKVFPRKEGEKVRAFVCGPPGQVAAVSGPKDGFKQGELAGALKELGYTSEEVFKF